MSFRCRLYIPPSDSALHPAPEGRGIRDQGRRKEDTEMKEGRVGKNNEGGEEQCKGKQLMEELTLLTKS